MRFVTVTDPKFFIGTAVLLHSIERNGRVSGWEAVVVHENLTDAHADYLKRINPRTEIVPLSSLPGVNAPAEQLSPRRRGRLKKLSIFTLFGRGKLCYLDSDMLCLGSIAELSAFPHFSAAIDMGRHLKPPVNGYPIFNAGMLIFEPAEAFASELQAFCRPDHFEKQADQFLLNDFMSTERPSDLNIVHSVYNTIASIAGTSPGYYGDLRAAGIRLLHFTNTKPWQSYRGLRGVRDVALEAPARFVARREFAAWHEMARDMKRALGSPYG